MGVAAIAVIAIIAISTGMAVATPVVVDAVDVDPDSPFYGLERLGERMRMVSTETQMEERWGEYARLVDRAKGLEYKHILEEFVGKMREVAPGDTATKQEVVQWMQEQMPEIERVKLGLMKKLCLKLQENVPTAFDELENELSDLGNLEQELPENLEQDNELWENIRARFSLIVEHLREIKEKYENTLGEEIRREISEYLDIDNLLVDVDVTVNVEVKIRGVGPPSLPVEFEKKVEEFDNLLAEVQAMLEGAPENAPGTRATRQLVDVAIGLRDNAVAAYGENKVRRALALIYAADMHLRNAERILEHASEWEPKFKEKWDQWRQGWDNVKQTFINEGIWENILKNWEQHRPLVAQRWQERLQERWQERGK